VTLYFASSTSTSMMTMYGTCDKNLIPPRSLGFKTHQAASTSKDAKEVVLEPPAASHVWCVTRAP
jgi:hypothetical protein